MSVPGAQDAERLTAEAGQDLPTDDGARDVHSDFGTPLRKAREKAGLSVADIADALKVTQRTVVALEAERYEELPPRPYIRGYVQRYARVVGLDSAAVTVGSDGVEDEPALPAVVPRSRWVSFNDFARESWGLVYGSIVLVFVILIGGALWWAWRGGNAEPTVPEAVPSTAREDSDPVAAASPPTPQVDTEVVSPVPAAPGQAPDSVDATPDQAPDSISAVPAAPDQAPDSTTAVPAAPDQAPDSTAAVPAAADQAPGSTTAVPAAADQALDSTAAVPESSDPAAAEPAPPEVAPVESRVVDETAVDRLARPDLITFVFAGECWVEVRGRGGDLVHGDLGRDGETVTVSGQAPFSVLLGNPNVVDVTFNGEPVSVDPGRPGEVARFQVGTDDDGSGTSGVVENGG